MHRRYSVASAALLAAAVCLLVPLVWLGVDRVGNADALNLIGGSVLPFVLACLLLSLGISIHAILKGRRSAVQLAVAGAALLLLLAPLAIIYL